MDMQEILIPIDIGRGFPYPPGTSILCRVFRRLGSQNHHSARTLFCGMGVEQVVWLRRRQTPLPQCSFTRCLLHPGSVLERYHRLSSARKIHENFEGWRQSRIPRVAEGIQHDDFSAAVLLCSFILHRRCLDGSRVPLLSALRKPFDGE